MDFKTGLYDEDGAGITGSTDLKLKIKRDADDYFFDFNDSTFKTSGHTTVAATLTEINATIVPGEYEYSQATSTWNDGVYTAYYSYVVAPAWTDAGEFKIADGVEVAMASLITASITDITTAILALEIDGTIDVLELFRALAATKIGDIQESPAGTFIFKAQDGYSKLVATKSGSSVTRTLNSSSSG